MLLRRLAVLRTSGSNITKVLRTTKNTLGGSAGALGHCLKQDLAVTLLIKLGYKKWNGSGIGIIYSLKCPKESVSVGTISIVLTLSHGF